MSYSSNKTWCPLLRPLPRDWSTPLQEYVNLRGSEASLDAPRPHTEIYFVTQISQISQIFLRAREFSVQTD